MSIEVKVRKFDNKEAQAREIMKALKLLKRKITPMMMELRHKKYFETKREKRIRKRAERKKKK